VLQLTIPTGVWETPLLVDACVARREHVGCPIHARPDTARSFVLAVGEKQCEALYENQSRDSLGLEEKWQVEAVELDPPGPGEVLVKLTASGLCHSDYHLVTGDTPVRFPFVGGHEGAGIVAGVGPGVTEVEEGEPICSELSAGVRALLVLFVGHDEPV